MGPRGLAYGKVIRITILSWGFRWTKRFLAIATTLALTAPSAQAVTIDVLWTGGGSAYNADTATLARTAGAFDPDGDGANDWNISFWDTMTPTPLPDLSLFDVRVIGSEADIFGAGIDESAVIAASPQIAAARGSRIADRGSRTFLTGQDADFHYRSGPGPVDDGPRGFLIDAVDRAASGAGLGIV